VATLAMDLLHNVLLRRPPSKLSSLIDARSVPARTRRRHRAEGMIYYRRLLRERVLREVMNGSRKEAAAWRWLLRNPGKRAQDAPPPTAPFGARVFPSPFVSPSTSLNYPAAATSAQTRFDQGRCLGELVGRVDRPDPVP
jgi:hypothetical protein